MELLIVQSRKSLLSASLWGTDPTQKHLRDVQQLQHPHLNKCFTCGQHEHKSNMLSITFVRPPDQQTVRIERLYRQWRCQNWASSRPPGMPDWQNFWHWITISHPGIPDGQNIWHIQSDYDLAQKPKPKMALNYGSSTRKPEVWYSVFQFQSRIDLRNRNDVRQGLPTRQSKGCENISGAIGDNDEALRKRSPSPKFMAQTSLARSCARSYGS